MTRYYLDDLPTREVFPGFHGRFVHSGAMTLAYWCIDAGAEAPEHSHPHEQVVTMQEGEMELVVGGERHRLRPGDIVPIPGGVTHSARAVTACRVLDLFSPVREDYR
jgi:quercetin dioxygenase-like cupin family protein